MLQSIKNQSSLRKSLSVASMICVALLVAGPGTASADQAVEGEALMRSIECGGQLPLTNAFSYPGPFPESAHAGSIEIQAVPGFAVSHEVENAVPQRNYGGSVIDFLAGMPETDRLNARIDFESGAGDGSLQADALQTIAAMWNLGRHNEALAELEAIGAASDPSLAVGVSWKVPRPTASIKMNSTQVGTAGETNGLLLESHLASGNVFAVSQDTSGTLNHFRVFLSQDNGLTWSETATWNNSFVLTDLDAVAIGDYLYVTYIYEGMPTSVRARRYLAATGLADSTYGVVEVFSDARVPTEVAIAASSTQIYLFAMLPDGVIRYHYANAEASFWTEVITGIITASHTMHAEYNPHSANNHFLFLSYVATDNNIWVYRRGGPSGNTWIDTGVTYFRDEVPVAAYADVILVPYIAAGSERNGVRYRISYDAGDTWLSGTIESGDTAGDDCFSPAATGRGGSGFIVAYQMDEAIDDHLHARYRDYIGNWRSRIQLTENDLSWGLPSDVEQLPEAGYGALTINGGSLTVSFDQSPLIFFDGMSLGDTGAWSAVLP